MGLAALFDVVGLVPSRRGTIYDEEDKFYSSLMICDLIVFSN